MSGYREPSFQDRVAAANRAKKTALDKLRNKPPVDEAELARRSAAQAAKDEIARQKREAARQAKAEAQAAKEQEARDAAAAALAAQPSLPTEEERKATRDARYAARKARKK